MWTSLVRLFEHLYDQGYGAEPEHAADRAGLGPRRVPGRRPARRARPARRPRRRGPGRRVLAGRRAAVAGALADAPGRTLTGPGGRDGAARAPRRGAARD